MEPDPIEQVLATNLRGQAGIVSAYLFGSHAENRAHRESDIDVGVLFDRGCFPTASERFDRRLELIGRLSSGLGRQAIDLVSLNDAPPLLGRAVVVRGRRFYCSNDALDHAFVRDVQLRAADLEPWLRRMRRIKLDRMAR